MTATRLAFQDGKLILRDGKAAVGEECCCRETVCDETCGWPRFLSVTVAGFPDGYYWASRNSGQPPTGGGFEPACGEGADAGSPQIRFGGVSAGTSGYQYSVRYRDYNATFVAEYVSGSGCSCAQWYGQIDVTQVSGDDGAPADECTLQPVGMTITLCQQQPFVNLVIEPPQKAGGQQATATVTGITGGAISGTAITLPGSEYAYLETERVVPTVIATVQSDTGTGADLSVTLEQTTDFNGDAVWKVKSVAVDDAGAGYLPGDSVSFAVTDGTETYSALASLSLNRQQPTLGVDVDTVGGSGAQFAVTLAAEVDFDGNDVWRVDSVAVTDGGSGYRESDEVTVSLGAGEIEQTPATLALRNVRGEPELTLTGTADFTVNVASLGGTPEAWEVASVDVIDGGSGYSGGQYLNIVLGPDDVQEPFAVALLRVKTVRDEPTVSVTPYDPSGEGAIFSVAIVPSGDVWIVDEVQITNGGTGYSEFDTFLLEATVGQTVVTGIVSVSVDGNGTIISVSIADAGQFFLDTGVIDEVEVLGGGRYYKDTGVIESVLVLAGGEYYETDGSIDSVAVTYAGEYYKEQYTGNVVVNTPAVSVVSNTGNGAVITATVDDDPDSATFGEVVLLTIDNGGQKYASEGTSWYLTFSGFGLKPLDGQRPNDPEGTFFLPPVGSVCQGADQSGEAGLFSDRVELTECGEALLSKTYGAFYFGTVFSGGVSNMPAGAKYSLSNGPFISCTELAVVDWGGGPMTVSISPA